MHILFLYYRFMPLISDDVSCVSLQNVEIYQYKRKDGDLADHKLLQKTAKKGFEVMIH